MLPASWVKGAMLMVAATFCAAPAQSGCPVAQKLVPGTEVLKIYWPDGDPSKGWDPPPLDYSKPYVWYWIYTPANYDSADAATKWPVIFDWPGAGQMEKFNSDSPEGSNQIERVNGRCMQFGDNNRVPAMMLMDGGAPDLLKTRFVTISPSSGTAPPIDGYEMQWFVRLMQDCMTRYHLDITRVYFSGLCYGSAIATRVMYNVPNLVSAVATTCFPEGVSPMVLYAGRPASADASDLSLVPQISKPYFRSFMNGADEEGSPASMQAFIAAVNAANPGHGEWFIPDPNGKHDCWTMVYTGNRFGSPAQSIYEWFLTKSNPSASFEAGAVPTISAAPRQAALSPMGTGAHRVYAVDGRLVCDTRTTSGRSNASTAPGVYVEKGLGGCRAMVR
jgi:hypothetical protein